MAIKEYSIEGVYKYRVRDESTGFVVHSTRGKHLTIAKRGV